MPKMEVVYACPRAASAAPAASFKVGFRDVGFLSVDEIRKIPIRKCSGSTELSDCAVFRRSTSDWDLAYLGQEPVSEWVISCALASLHVAETEGFQRRIKFMYASTGNQTAEDSSRFRRRSAHHRSIHVPSLARHRLEMA